MKKKDGGPAFYAPGYGEGGTAAMGMSLRDYFAGQALAGLMATNHDYFDKELALHCYDVADAMLAERERTTNATA
jgi:hypothetical protein